jgi:hypothetical protein
VAAQSRPVTRASEEPATRTDDVARNIAKAIADAIESPVKQFRWPAGADAEKLLAARAKLDDDAFESALRGCAAPTRGLGLVRGHQRFASTPRGNFTTLELTPGRTCPDKVPQWGMPRADLLSGAQR